MKNETRLLSHTDNIMFGYWDADKEEFVELRILNSSEEEAIADARSAFMRESAKYIQRSYRWL